MFFNTAGLRHINLVFCSLYTKPWLLANETQMFIRLCIALGERASRVQPRKMATDLAIGQWAFLHALQVTRTHDVHCHCKNVRRVIQYSPDRNKHVDTERLYKN